MIISHDALWHSWSSAGNMRDLKIQHVEHIARIRSFRRRINFSNKTKTTVREKGRTLRTTPRQVFRASRGRFFIRGKKPDFRHVCGRNIGGEKHLWRKIANVSAIDRRNVQIRRASFDRSFRLSLHRVDFLFWNDLLVYEACRAQWRRKFNRRHRQTNLSADMNGVI